MKFDIDHVNAALAGRARAVFEPADDDSMDDMIAVYVNDRDAGGIQLLECGHACLATMWNPPLQNMAMTFGDERHDVMEALDDLVKMMEAAGWFDADGTAAVVFEDGSSAEVGRFEPLTEEELTKNTQSVLNAGQPSD